MAILGNIWDKWVTSESIIKAARRTGISKDGFNVKDIQQDKFEQAANLIAQSQNKSTPDVNTQSKISTRSSIPTGNSQQLANTPRSMSNLAKQKHRYGSTKNWKCMFEHPGNHPQ